MLSHHLRCIAGERRSRFKYTRFLEVSDGRGIPRSGIQYFRHRVAIGLPGCGVWVWPVHCTYADRVPLALAVTIHPHPEPRGSPVT